MTTVSWRTESVATQMSVPGGPAARRALSARALSDACARSGAGAPMAAPSAAYVSSVVARRMTERMVVAELVMAHEDRTRRGYAPGAARVNAAEAARDSGLRL